MTGNTHESPPFSCYPCWAHRKKCDYETFSRHCTRCNARLPRGVDNISVSPSFPGEGIEKHLREELFPGMVPTALPYIDDMRIWFPRFSLDPKAKLVPKVASLYLKIHGTWNHRHPNLVTPFDNLISEVFSVGLLPNKPESKLIYFAALAGGYLRVLSSTTTITSATVQVGPFNDQLNLALRRLFIYRFSDLINPIMTAVREDALSNMQPGSSETVYAAAAILQFGIERAKSGLRIGAFSESSNKTPPEPKPRPFLEWLEALEHELNERLAQACRKKTAWGSAFDAPNSTLRRPAEEVQIIAHFTQYRVSKGPSHESRIPALPSSPSHQSLSLIPHRTWQTPSISAQFQNAGLEGYPTPPVIATVPPPRIMRDTHASHQTNHLLDSASLEIPPQGPGAFWPRIPGTETEEIWNGSATATPGMSNNLHIDTTAQTSQSPDNPLHIFSHGQNRSISLSSPVSYSESNKSVQEWTSPNLDFSFVDTQGHENINDDVDMESFMVDPCFLLSIRGLN